MVCLYLFSLVLNQPVDILILSNGPGEVTTWVLPVVKALRQQLGHELVRISVVLSPCPNATGKEAAIARSYQEVDRVLPREQFFPFLLWGKIDEAWDWRQRGVVLFLGGDQFYAVAIGKRLGYSTVVYAEWEARWYRWIDRFAVMQPAVIEKVPLPYRHKLTVVGDLMADVEEAEPGHGKELIGLLPGSKASKLAQGVPLCLAIAQQIHRHRPQTRFIVPVAPTLDLPTLAQFADPQQNPILNRMGGVSGQLITEANQRPYLKTPQGVHLELVTQFPADELSQCRLCITTVGANTAQLGALGVPMIVLLPTQQLDAMRSWDGIPGILANLPGLGSGFARLINWFILKQGRLFAWPNIWANAEIVPEVVGEIQAEEVASMVLDFLNNPQKLTAMRDRLLEVRGKPGAALQIAHLVCEVLSQSLGD